MMRAATAIFTPALLRIALILDADRGHAPPAQKKRETTMLDLAAIVATIVFFGLGALFVRGCDLI